MLTNSELIEEVVYLIFQGAVSLENPSTTIAELEAILGDEC